MFINRTNIVQFKQNLEHAVFIVFLLPLQALQPKRRRIPVLHILQGCEGRGAAIGQKGEEAERVQQASVQALVTLLAQLFSPRVHVNSHPVPIPRYAAAHSTSATTRGVYRKPSGSLR